MARFLPLAILVLSSAAALVPAQQVGDSDRNYSINGIGLGEASGVRLPLPTPGLMVNEYRTNDAFAPVIWAMASQRTNGWNQTATSSIDLGPAGIVILGDGSAPGLLNQTLFTDASGDATWAVNAQSDLDGRAWFAMAHLSGASPDGYFVSQTIGVDFGCETGFAGTQLALGDDDSIVRDLNFDVAFYGTTYTQVYVGSNGFLTFGAPNTAFSESVSRLERGPARIAAFWDDFNPASSGEVTFSQSGRGPFRTFGSFHVCWEEVPEFSALGANTNTFRATFERFPMQPARIRLSYGNMTSQDGIVGLSAGGSLSVSLPQVFVSTPIDMSGNGSLPTQLTSAVYEQFNSNNRPDLAAEIIEFELNGNGVPSSFR